MIPQYGRPRAVLRRRRQIPVRAEEFGHAGGEAVGGEAEVNEVGARADEDLQGVVDGDRATRGVDCYEGVEGAAGGGLPGVMSQVACGRGVGESVLDAEVEGVIEVNHGEGGRGKETEEREEEEEG